MSSFDQQEPPPEDLAIDLRAAHPPRALLGVGEGEGDAGDIEEQREDGIMMAEAVPRGMVHLLAEPAVRAAREQGAEGHDHGGEAHDEHHVESPQRIQRKKSLIRVHFVQFLR